MFSRKPRNKLGTSQVATINEVMQPSQHHMKLSAIVRRKMYVKRYGPPRSAVDLSCRVVYRRGHIELSFAARVAPCRARAAVYFIQHAVEYSQLR